MVSQGNPAPSWVNDNEKYCIDHLAEMVAIPRLFCLVFDLFSVSAEPARRPRLFDMAEVTLKMAYNSG